MGDEKDSKSLPTLSDAPHLVSAVKDNTLRHYLLKQLVEAMRKIEESRENCIGTKQPDEHCHRKSQDSLHHALSIYEKIIADYKKRLPNRSTPTPAV